jgi:hypothetical protein
MNYLTNYYKNLSEQLQEKVNFLNQTILEAQRKTEDVTHHENPHFLDIVQHNAKMHAFVGGGGEVTREHIDQAQKIIAAAEKAGHVGLDYSRDGKIGWIGWTPTDYFSANPEEPREIFTPITPRTTASTWNSLK